MIYFTYLQCSFWDSKCLHENQKYIRLPPIGKGRLQKRRSACDDIFLKEIRTNIYITILMPYNLNDYTSEKKGSIDNFIVYGLISLTRTRVDSLDVGLCSPYFVMVIDQSLCICLLL